jgi:hypothetical protein
MFFAVSLHDWLHTECTHIQQKRKASDSGSSEPKAAKKGKKGDKGAPVRPVSAYIQFSNEMRAEVREENPGEQRTTSTTSTSSTSTALCGHCCLSLSSLLCQRVSWSYC